MSTDEHRMKASVKGAISLSIVTVSDTRTKDTDTNASYLKKQIEDGGNIVVDHCIVKDEYDQVEKVLKEIVNSDSQVIIFNGGTGISKRDRTFDVIDQKLEKRLTGFGEIFRMLSYEQVGAAAMLSRATAGIYKNKVIISLPGSTKAVELAWEKLISPELQHLAWELNK